MRLPILVAILGGPASHATGWYIDPVDGNDANSGDSPSEAWQSYDNLADLTTEQWTNPVFTKIAGSFVRGHVITLTTEASATKPIAAGQNIARSSGATAVWVWGAGFTNTESDTIATDPGFPYVAEGDKTFHILLPSGKAGVTGIGLVDAHYVPGAGMPSFAGFTDLVSLDLSLNNFGGSIPDLVDMPVLQSCLLDRTGVTGPLGEIDLPSLVELWLWGDEDFPNSLSGTLPSFAGSLNLQELRIEENDFTGSLPSFASNTALVTFRAFNNDFSGTLPSFLDCVDLAELNLADNSLSGTIPSFATLDALVTLDLNGNAFTGFTAGGLDGCINCSVMDFKEQDVSLAASVLEDIIDSCVVRDALPGSVNATLDLRQFAGSIAGYPGIATLQASGWTVNHF